MQIGIASSELYYINPISSLLDPALLSHPQTQHRAKSGQDTCDNMSRLSEEKRAGKLDGELNYASRNEADMEGVGNDDILLGYEQKLIKNRSMYTILFQSLAITAVPFGEGTALISAIYGGGQLSYFVGWILVSILDQCLFMSLAELCSKFPTSAGPVSLSSSTIPQF